MEVVHNAFLLEPDMPAAGADMRERLGRKYGAERVEAMFQRVTQAGAQYGVQFDFSKVRRSPQTAPSHELIEWAPQEKRSALSAAAHRAHFDAKGEANAFFRRGDSMIGKTVGTRRPRSARVAGAQPRADGLLVLAVAEQIAHSARLSGIVVRG